MKLRNVAIVIVVLLCLSIGSGLWLFNKLTSSMEVTNSIDVELTMQEVVEENVYITMVISNNSDKAIVDYKVGLILSSTNYIDIKSSEKNEPLNANAKKEFKFVYPKDKVTYDFLNPDDFEVHVEGYIEEVGKYNDFTLDSHYQYYVQKRESN